jgi:GrpB-like predicted nucleotidyltransferase (UPF0157 family)
MAEPLVISAYDPRWPLMFGELRDRASDALRELAVSIEHVGSTAVPGLAAKPVIDLDAVVAAFDDVREALDRLAALGYEPGGRSGTVTTIPGLAAPRWPRGERRHHLYVVVDGSAVHRERIAFRDYLRAHPAEMRRYAELKARAARDSGQDQERYSRAKHEYVQRVLGIAMARR